MKSQTNTSDLSKRIKDEIITLILDSPLNIPSIPDDLEREMYSAILDVVQKEIYLHTKTIKCSHWFRWICGCGKKEMSVSVRPSMDMEDCKDCKDMMLMEDCKDCCKDMEDCKDCCKDMKDCKDCCKDMEDCKDCCKDMKDCKDLSLIHI